MIDLNSQANDNKLIIRWAGLGNGMLADYTTTNMNKAKDAIDQMFIQSSYINHN
jgi:hypothetical protein